MFKFHQDIAEITTLIVLSIVALTSFIIASKLGNQSQELRSRAQTYTVSPTPFGVSIDCMSDVNPDNFCATATYCPDGFTKISGYCKNSGACCKKDLAPCISTANPNNFCATAAYCPTGSTKISGYCANSGACCKRNLLPTPSPRVCLSPNVCHYGGCSTGYSMVSDKCEGTNIVCCKPKSSPTPFCPGTCMYGNTCSLGYVSKITNGCGTGNLICCEKTPIVKRINSLSCQEYNMLIGWSCDPNKVSYVFEGQISCPGGPTKNKGCALYCEPGANIVIQDYCDWAPDGAPSPRVCLSPNVCHYGGCSTGYSMVSDKCEGTNIVCCKPAPATPKPTPESCNNSNHPHNICAQGECYHQNYIPTSGYCEGTTSVCCQPNNPVIKPVTNLSCDQYNRLIGWPCDLNKVIEIFKGQISCSNGPSKNKGCRLYCGGFDTDTVQEEYCDWVTNNALNSSVSIVNGTSITWNFCSSSDQEIYTKMIASVPGIFPKNNFEFVCSLLNNQNNNIVGLAYTDKIKIYCNPNLTKEEQINKYGGYTCEGILDHELTHIWQSQKNISASNSYGADNNDFNILIGCQQLTNESATFSIQQPVSDYGKTNCAEAFAEAGRFYTNPDLACDMKQNQTTQYNFFKDNIFNGKEFCNP